MKLRLPLSLASALALSFVASTTSHAATVKWSAASGNWGETSNWDTGGLPTSEDRAEVSINSNITVNGEYTAKEVYLTGTTTTKTIVGDASGESELIISSLLWAHGGTITFGDGINTLNFTATNSQNNSIYFRAELADVYFKEKVNMTMTRMVLGDWTDRNTNLYMQGATITLHGSGIDSNSPLTIGADYKNATVSTLNVESGLLNVRSGAALIGRTGGGKINIQGGVSNFKEVVLSSITAANKDYERSLNIQGGRLNIGSGGIRISDTVGASAIAINLGNGILGAYSDWSSEANMVLTSGEQITINTTDSDNNSTARTISLSGTLSGSGGLIKDGTGTLVLSGANSYSGTTTVKKGILTAQASSIDGTSSVELYNGATISGEGLTTFNKGVTVHAGSGTSSAIWNGDASITNLTITSSSAMVRFNGKLNLSGDINITVDHSTASMGPLMTFYENAALSFSETSKINITAYNDALDETVDGIVTLTITLPGYFGTNTIIPEIVWTRTDEKYRFDSSDFATTGAVTWTSTGKTFNLIMNSEGSTPFTAPDDVTYLGAKEDPVTFAESNTYTPYTDGHTRLTDGYGTFIFQPVVANTGALLIFGLGQNHSVVITNNDNAQTRTEITDTTLVVDTTQGGTTATANTGILGTGAVSIYGSKKYPGGLELRVSGDVATGDTYQINNNINLDGYTNITQSGANPHQLNGTITVRAGSESTIENKSSEDLIIASNINVANSSTLQLKTTTGQIVLSGDKTLTSNKLDVTGPAGLVAEDGYTITVGETTLGSNTSITLDDATLNLETGSITGGNDISITNSTINFNDADSSTIESTITASGTNTINTKDAKNVTTLAGGITGTGDIIKEGKGKLIMANATPNTSGTITVEEGSLQLGNNSGKVMEDQITPVPETYTLRGELIVNNGSLSGIINADNNKITFGSKSAFEVSFDNSDLSSSITNAGDITVADGATILVSTLSQTWNTGKEYAIISSNTSISGAQFKLTQEQEFAFVDINMTQTSNQVSLSLSQKVPEITPTNRNEAVIFPVVTKLVFQALEGRYGSLNGQLLQDMQYISKMSTTGFSQYLSDTAQSASSLYTALSGQVANTTKHVQSVRNRVTQLDPELFDQYQLHGNRNIWVESFINYADVDSESHAPGYQLDSWGAHTGISFSVSDKAFFGAGFGYIYGKTKVKNGYGESETDNYVIDLFGRYKEGDFSLSAVVSGGFSDVDYERNSTLGSQARKSKASADGSQVLALIEAAYDIALNEEATSVFQPMANISAGFAKIEGFDETGLGNAGYHIDDQQVTLSTIGAGARYFYTIPTADSYTPYRMEVRAMVTQDVGDTAYDIKASYIGARQHNMNLEGVSMERTAFSVGASAVIPISRFGSIFGDFTSEFRSGQNSISANIGMNFLF